MSISTVATVYNGKDQSGTARLYGVSKSARYQRVRRADLAAAGLDRAISSATLYASSDAENVVILFGFPNFGWFSFPDFSGGYQQLANQKGSGKEYDVNLTTFDNTARSVLLVATRRRSEFRISFRDAFLQKWNSTLDALLKGTQASRDGNPTLTWEMFPENVSYLSSDRAYLRIHQDLNIELDWWPDYDASVTYHIFLYINGSGNLRGYVQRWAYWVEGGAKSDDIAEELEPKVKQGMTKLNEELASSLSAFDGLGFRDVYYLPGKQTGTTTPASLTGWTTDDVTIVLER